VADRKNAFSCSFFPLEADETSYSEAENGEKLVHNKRYFLQSRQKPVVLRK